MFQVNHLNGFGAAGSGAAPKVLTYKGAARQDTSGTVVTLSVDIGTASADRYVIVAVGGCTSTRTVSSLTIAGVTATQIVASSAAETSAIYMALVTSGSGAQNIVITWSGAQDVTGIGVWTLTGVSGTTPVDTKTSTANPFTATLSTVNGGVAVAYAMVTNTTTYTWTNLTEQFDTTAAGVGHSGAQDAANTGASISITCTASGYDSRSSMVAASW